MRELFCQKAGLFQQLAQGKKAGLQLVRGHMLVRWNFNAEENKQISRATSSEKTWAFFQTMLVKLVHINWLLEHKFHNQLDKKNNKNIPKYYFSRSLFASWNHNIQDQILLRLYFNFTVKYLLVLSVRQKDTLTYSLMSVIRTVKQMFSNTQRF